MPVAVPEPTPLSQVAQILATQPNPGLTPAESQGLAQPQTEAIAPDALDLFGGGLKEGAYQLRDLSQSAGVLASYAWGGPTEEQLRKMLQYQGEAEERYRNLGVETFSEFLADPTLSGMGDQFLYNMGMFLPSLAAAAATGGVGGAIAGAAVRGGTTKLIRGVAQEAAETAVGRTAGAEAAKRVGAETAARVTQQNAQGFAKSEIRRLMAKQARRETLTPDEAKVMSALQRGVSKLEAARSMGKKAGAILGTGTVLGTGAANIELQEATGYGERAPTPGELALTVGGGVVVGAIGMGGEGAVLWGLARVAGNAGRKSAADAIEAGLRTGMIKGALKGGTLAGFTEGLTEATEEAGLIGIREALEPGSAAETDITTRLVDAFGAGLTGGAGIGGVGGAGRGRSARAGAVRESRTREALEAEVATLEAEVEAQRTRSPDTVVDTLPLPETASPKEILADKLARDTANKKREAQEASEAVRLGNLASRLFDAAEGALARGEEMGPVADRALKAARDLTGASWKAMERTTPDSALRKVAAEGARRAQVRMAKLTPAVSSVSGEDFQRVMSDASRWADDVLAGSVGDPTTLEGSAMRAGVSPVPEKISTEVWGQAREQAQKAWGQAKEQAQEQAQGAWEQAQGAWEQVRGQATREQAQGAWEQAQGAWEQAQRLWEQTPAPDSETWNRARDQAQRAWEQARGAWEQTPTPDSETWKQAWGRAQRAWGQAQQVWERSPPPEPAPQAAPQDPDAPLEGELMPEEDGPQAQYMSVEEQIDAMPDPEPITHIRAQINATLKPDTGAASAQKTATYLDPQTAFKFLKQYKRTFGPDRISRLARGENVKVRMPWSQQEMLVAVAAADDNIIFPALMITKTEEDWRAENGYPKKDADTEAGISVGPGRVLNAWRESGDDPSVRSVALGYEKPVHEISREQQAAQEGTGAPAYERQFEGPDPRVQTGDPRTQAPLQEGITPFGTPEDVAGPAPAAPGRGGPAAPQTEPPTQTQFEQGRGAVIVVRSPEEGNVPIHEEVVSRARLEPRMTKLRKAFPGYIVESNSPEVVLDERNKKRVREEVDRQQPDNIQFTATVEPRGDKSRDLFFRIPDEVFGYGKTEEAAAAAAMADLRSKLPDGVSMVGLSFVPKVYRFRGNAKADAIRGQMMDRLNRTLARGDRRGPKVLGHGGKRINYLDRARELAHVMDTADDVDTFTEARDAYFDMVEKWKAERLKELVKEYAADIRAESDRAADVSELGSLSDALWAGFDRSIRAKVRGVPLESSPAYEKVFLQPNLFAQFIRAKYPKAWLGAADVMRLHHQVLAPATSPEVLKGMYRRAAAAQGYGELNTPLMGASDALTQAADDSDDSNRAINDLSWTMARIMGLDADSGRPVSVESAPDDEQILPRSGDRDSWAIPENPDYRGVAQFTRGAKYIRSGRTVGSGRTDLAQDEVLDVREQRPAAREEETVLAGADRMSASELADKSGATARNWNRFLGSLTPRTQASFRHHEHLMSGSLIKTLMTPPKGKGKTGRGWPGIEQKVDYRIEEEGGRLKLYREAPLFAEGQLTRAQVVYDMARGMMQNAKPDPGYAESEVLKLRWPDGKKSPLSNRAFAMMSGRSSSLAYQDRVFEMFRKGMTDPERRHIELVTGFAALYDHGFSFETPAGKKINYFEEFINDLPAVYYKEIGRRQQDVMYTMGALVSPRAPSHDTILSDDSPAKAAAVGKKRQKARKHTVETFLDMGFHKERPKSESPAAISRAQNQIRENALKFIPQAQIFPELFGGIDPALARSLTEVAQGLKFYDVQPDSMQFVGLALTKVFSVDSLLDGLSGDALEVGRDHLNRVVEFGNKLGPLEDSGFGGTFNFAPSEGQVRRQHAIMGGWLKSEKMQESIQAFREQYLPGINRLFDADVLGAWRATSPWSPERSAVTLDLARSLSTATPRATEPLLNLSRKDADALEAFRELMSTTETTTFSKTDGLALDVALETISSEAGKNLVMLRELARSDAARELMELSPAHAQRLYSLPLKREELRLEKGRLEVVRLEEKRRLAQEGTQEPPLALRPEDRGDTRGVDAGDPEVAYDTMNFTQTTTAKQLEVRDRALRDLAYGAGGMVGVIVDRAATLSEYADLKQRLGPAAYGNERLDEIAGRMAILENDLDRASEDLKGRLTRYQSAEADTVATPQMGRAYDEVDTRNPTADERAYDPRRRSIEFEKKRLDARRQRDENRKRENLQRMRANTRGQVAAFVKRAEEKKAAAKRTRQAGGTISEEYIRQMDEALQALAAESESYEEAEARYAIDHAKARARHKRQTRVAQKQAKVTDFDGRKRLDKAAVTVLQSFEAVFRPRFLRENPGSTPPDPQIFTVEQLRELYRQKSMPEALGDKAAMDALANLGKNQKLKGVTLTYPDGNVVVVVRDAASYAGGAAEQAGALAHELGHVVYNSLTKDVKSGERDLLMSAFTDAKRGRGVEIDPDKLEHEFNEWLADKIGAEILRQPGESRLVDDVVNKVDPSKADAVIKWIKNIARQLRQLIKDLPLPLKIRLRRDPGVEEFVDELLLRAERGEAQYTIVPQASPEGDTRTDYLEINPAVVRDKVKARAFSAKDMWDTMQRWTVPAGAYIRSHGPEDLANFFYGRSRTREGLGFLDEHLFEFNRMANRLGSILGVRRLTEGFKPSETVIKGLAVAEDDLWTGEGKGPEYDVARKLRKFFADHAPTDTDLRKNYFPRQFDIVRLDSSAQAQAQLVELIMEYVTNHDDKLVSRGTAEQIVRNMLDDGNHNGIDGISRGDGYSPGMRATHARALGQIPTKSLRDVGLLRPAEEAAMAYAHQYARREAFLKRIPGDSKDPSSVTAYMDGLIAASENPEKMRTVVRGVLGHLGREVPPSMRLVNSAAFAAVATTTLGMSLFSSFTDPVYSMARASGLGSGAMRIWAKQLRDSARADGDNAKLARAVGTATNDALTMLFMSTGTHDLTTPLTRKVLSTFFRAAGLDWITRFTRVQATGMGREFIREAILADADPRMDRYLAELFKQSAGPGMSDADIAAEVRSQLSEWAAGRGNVPKEHQERMVAAIRKFVAEGSVMPNTGTRPAMGNNPWFNAVYTLKSFNYDVGMRVLSGALREAKNRKEEDGYGAMAASMLPLALTIPVTMVSLEAREGVKWAARSVGDAVGLGWAPPEAAFRSDYMNPGAYAVDILDRSGNLGPVVLGLDVMQALGRGDNPILETIPALDMAATIADGDLSRAVPFVNNL